MRAATNLTNAPKASIISRRLQAILRRIHDNGIQSEIKYATRQFRKLERFEKDLGGYEQSLLDELRQKIKREKR